MDLSTIGVKFGWAVEETAGTKPTAFKWIKRCSKIGGLNISKEKIETTCFEDKIKTYIAGVSDTGGDWNINFNGTKKGSATDVAKAGNELLEKSEAGADEGKATWADIFIPGSAGTEDKSILSVSLDDNSDDKKNDADVTINEGE